MPAVLTAINAHLVLGYRPDRFHQTVPEVLQKLLEPDLDEFVLYHYCKTFHDWLNEDSERDMGEMGFEPFAQACFEGGLIETFLSIAKSPKTDKWTDVLEDDEDGEDGEMDYACVAYITAAELAASLISFNVASRGSYQEAISGVKREQVLCLGNAAEMALGQELYQAALHYAQAAVRYAAALPTDGPDGIADSIREKNLRRVARAEGLGTT